MNYEFNGLLDAALPNVYVNKITLERLSTKPLSENKYDLMPHIAPTEEQAGSLTPTYGTTADSLKVIVDMFLEIPSVEDNDFWNFLFNGDVAEFLSTSLMVFSGTDGKTYFTDLMGQTNSAFKDIFLMTYDSFSVENFHNFIAAGGLDLGSSVQLISQTGMFDNSTLSKMEDVAHQKQHTMQKYTKTLPDGTVVYKVPLRMEATIDSGPFPTDLAIIAYCTLDVDNIINSLSEYGATAEDIASINLMGRVATEVIIRNNKVQDKGMMFFISENQEDEAHNKAFNHLKGQLWFGSVHKHGTRYMVGNKHSAEIHPYLDYIMVPNTRIHDFRQVATIQKEIINFNPGVEEVLGKPSVDLRATKNSNPASLDNPGLFSNLISSVDRTGRVKLFFSIDWGKLIKNRCAVPGVLDKMANSTGTTNWDILNHQPLSFRVFRERQAGGNSNNGAKAINRTNRELIYDAWPSEGYSPHPKAGEIMSSLQSVNLGAGFSASGFLRHFTFTDWSAETIDKGMYKYSIEIVTKDPTLDYLIALLKNNFTPALAALKSYVYIASGTGTTAGKAQQYYDSYLGEFTKEFKLEAEKLGFSDGANGALPTNIQQTIQNIKFLTSIMKPGTIASATSDDLSPPVDWVALFKGMLNPSSASPDSIITVYKIFETFTAQLRNFVESFAIAKIPKTNSAVDANGAPILKQFTKMPIGAATPQKRITIEHAFEDFVNTHNMAAAYDFFGDVADPQNGLGLKKIYFNNYGSRSQKDWEKYFKGGTKNVLIGFQNYKKNNEIFYTSVDVERSKGRFFTIPSDATSVSVVLPKSIKDPGEENSYWQLINNIIRYKFNLLGNPNEPSWLGYGQPDASPPGLEISDTMERILKEQQSLYYKNAIVMQDRPPTVDRTMTEGIVEMPNEFLGPGRNLSFDQDILIPQNENMGVDSDPLPNNAKDSEAADIMFPTKWDYATNISQERFLLSLIMDSYFNLDTYDIKLGTFDTKISNAPVGLYLNNRIPWGDNPALAANAVKSGIEIMPASLQSLIVNNTPNAAELDKLSPATKYVSGNKDNTLYDSQSADNITMFINNFGEFWFKHQNLVEMQYLSGYDTTLPTPGPSKKFGDVYTSSVKSPVWTPMNMNVAASLFNAGGGSVLCRFKKYRSSFFNREAYNILDLPILDEYFFLEINAT